MFSFYDEGIHNNTPSSTIEISQLVDIIRNNPYQKDFSTLRLLSKEDPKYSELKLGLPRCQPNCVVKYNSIKKENFDRNYLRGSGYVYLDLDNISDAEGYKQQLICKYPDMISLICISSGGKGLSLLIRINEIISSHCHFKKVMQFLKREVFTGLNFDEKTERLGNMWFVSQDPNLYYNPSALVTVPTAQNCLDQSILHSEYGNNTLYYAEKRISKIPISLINRSLNTSTLFPGDKPIHIETIDWVEIKLPRVIKDGKRASTLTSLIHRLFHLNPEVDPVFIFAYIYRINEHLTEPKWRTYRDLQALFNFHYRIIHTEGYVFKGSRKKRVHISKELNIEGVSRPAIANTLNAAIKSNRTKKKILKAIEELRDSNQKETASAIHRLSGVSRGTVIKHLKNLELLDIDSLIRDLLNKQK